MAHELPRLLELYPRLASLAVARQGNIVHFTTPSNGCALLDADHWCRIEREHGPSLKPAVCRLFPFNVLQRVGDVVSIRPHFLCGPLRAVVPPRPGVALGTHAFVEDTIRSTGLLDPAYVGQYVPRARLHPASDALSTIRREGLFRDAAVEALGRLAFHDFLRNAAGDGGRFDDSVRRARVLMGLDASVVSSERDEVDDILILLASPLRMTMLSLSADGLLVALVLAGDAFRHALALGARPSLSAGWDVARGAGSALRLLGRLDAPLVEDASKPPAIPSFTDPDLALAATIALRAPRSGGTLAALERAIPAALSNVSRAVLLRAIGSLVDNDGTQKAAVGAT
jgi:hypothetical protein